MRYARVIFRGFLVLLMAVGAFVLSDRVVRSFWSFDDAWIVTVTSVGTAQSVLFDMPSLEEGESPDLQGKTAWQQVRIPLIVRFEVGDRQGEQQEVVVEQLSASGLSIAAGQRYILAGDVFPDGTSQFYLSDRYRAPWVVGCIVFLAGALVAGTGGAGLRALGGLLLSLMVLLFWFVPAVHDGAPPVFSALGAVTMVSVCTVVIVVRRFQWWFVAFGGAFGGSLLALGLGSALVSLWNLTGLSGEGGALLASTLPSLSLRGLLVAGVLVGSVGAVLDVAISITATMAELVAYDPKISLRRLWSAGLGVGKEVLGSMINTLILAYLGGALPFAVLIAEARPSFWGFFNDPSITEEMLRSLAGTAGLLLTVPLTAALGVGFLYGKNGGLIRSGQNSEKI